MDTNERIIRLFEHHRIPLQLRHPGWPASRNRAATTGLHESLDMLDRYAKTDTRGYVGQRLRAHEELMMRAMESYSFHLGEDEGFSSGCSCNKPYHHDDLFVVTDAGMAASQFYAAQAVNKLTEGGIPGAASPFMYGRIDCC